jgi:predicted transcriptional regulator YdeE
LQKKITTKPQINLTGITVRTSFDQENGESRIYPCVMKYFHEQLFDKIPNRASPGTTYCAYTDYESDYKGAYTYFIGEETAAPDAPLPEGFQLLTIPKQKYNVFTTTPDPMPDVLVKAWNEIWQMSEAEFGSPPPLPHRF